MNNERLILSFKHSWLKYSGACVTALLLYILTVSASAAANDQAFESPKPILISTANSTRALAIKADNWRSALPERNSEVFQPGSRVVVFVTNVKLLPEERANAFRVYAEDAGGKQYGLTVENIQQLPKQNWIYGLTIYIHDRNGYNGQPQPNGDVLIGVSWRGNTSNRVRLGLGGTGGKIKDDAGAVPTPAPPARRLVKSIRSSEIAADRKRFMEQAAFGPTPVLDSRLQKVGLSGWIEEQFEMPYPTIAYPNFPLKPFVGPQSCASAGTSQEIELCNRNHYWNYNNQNWLFKEALYGEDQLRRRVSWALHQIWVVSHERINQQRGMQEYIEVLDKHAFGNYRDLMKEMTLNPAMGEYLDMVRSTRTNPNENYPREILQLFTIGLYMLNQDGTLVLDEQGKPIPTFDQDKIEQFTKIFTGWTRCNDGENPACPNAVSGAWNLIDPMYLVFPNDHDQTEKVLFDYPGAPNPIIEACFFDCVTDEIRRAYADDSLEKTLDNIFYHPNVGPFIGKILIQHFVTSNPSPAYVGRVAAAFNDNGAGVRGDMKAVIRTILLDPEARGSEKTDPAYGKLREPLQLITNLLRTFNVRAGAYSYGESATPPASCQNRSDGVLDSVTRAMEQDIWNPPSVFNYFPPTFAVPGTDITGPEFALANTGLSFERNNVIFHFTMNGGVPFNTPTTSDPYPLASCGTSIDLSEATALVMSDPTGKRLIEELNTKMMHGTMSEAMKNKIRTAITVNVPLKLRAKQAVYLVASSSQYQIQR